MDLASMQDAVDRVSKKQKLSYTKTEDVIDKCILEIQQAMCRLEGGGAGTRSVLSELQHKLEDMNGKQLTTDLSKELSKLGKLMDKQFETDVSKAYRKMEFDSHLLNQIIALHFYRQGLFDLGDCFVRESQEAAAAELKAPFYEMYQILEHMKNKNLEPAIAWAERHHKELQERGSSLEFKLHKLEFVHILLKGGQAVEYMRRNLGSRFSSQVLEIQKLMCCLVFHRRGGSNPYLELLSPSLWESVATDFTKECCSLLGQAFESPLHVTILAGSQALPAWLKLAKLVEEKKVPDFWESKKLPVEIELAKEFQFHSVFACPVSKEPCTADNPPMLLPCGHVLCKQSVHRMGKGSNTRPFKCPYCPTETSAAGCRQIHF